MMQQIHYRDITTSKIKVEAVKFIADTVDHFGGLMWLPFAEFPLMGLRVDYKSPPVFFVLCNFRISLMPQMTPINIRISVPIIGADSAWDFCTFTGCARASIVIKTIVAVNNNLAIMSFVY